MRRTMRVNCSDVFFRNRIHWSWQFALGGWCERLKPRGREHERRPRTMRLMILGGGSGSYAESKFTHAWRIWMSFGLLVMCMNTYSGPGKGARDCFLIGYRALSARVHMRKSKGRVGWEYLGWWLYHKTKHQWLHHECWEFPFHHSVVQPVSIA